MKYKKERFFGRHTMLLIDCHEPDEIIKKLEPFLPTRALALKYGDYTFSDTVIERKTLSDFFSSIKNNRLKEQMENISRFYTEKYLLIEGFFDFDYVNNIEYLYSGLIDITLDSDVKVMFSKDIGQTINTIKRIYRQRNFGYPIHVLKKDRIYHASKFFGISKRKLEMLFSRFDNIRNIMNAEKKDFKELSGIGESTVKSIKKSLESNIFKSHKLSALHLQNAADE
ncbi:hypothetical protein HYY71_07305 [Candidatus Woesearchaeota archaeon]|nr:hypothetical protein [Candidatus Woesearchaeota archaeon]